MLFSWLCIREVASLDKVFFYHTQQSRNRKIKHSSIPLRHDFESDEWRNTASIFIPGLFLCQEG